jgi:hypothetical protein
LQRIAAGLNKRGFVAALLLELADLRIDRLLRRLSLSLCCARCRVGAEKPAKQRAGTCEKTTDDRDG